MMSTCSGHVIISETSLTTKMQYTYKFSGRKEEAIDVDTELANRSQKLRERTEYVGSFKFISSAYSHYNFASGISFISHLGHAETKFEVNNAPDLEDPNYTMTATMTLAKNNDANMHSRTMFAIEVARPKSSTDLKFLVTYNTYIKNGTDHNVFMLVRYATNKEMNLTGSVFIPRGQLFGFESKFSLAIPDMNNCSAAVTIKERIKKYYLVSFIRLGKTRKIADIS
jgi:hypothetical protein